VDLSDIAIQTETIPTVSGHSIYHCIYRYGASVPDRSISTPDTTNRIFSEFSINDLIARTIRRSFQSTCREHDFSFYGSGWQSWGYGGEILPEKQQLHYIPLFPQLKQYISFPGSIPPQFHRKQNKKLTGQFIIYLRWKTIYLVIASTGNSKALHSPLRKPTDASVLPPVNFYVDRMARTISCMVYSNDKWWTKNELIADLCIFSAENFFQLRDTIRQLYGTADNSHSLAFLSSSDKKIVTGGWESWYNHYNHINQKLILDELAALNKTETITSTWFTNRKKPAIFQIDDGWEQGIGQWEADRSLFPGGMESLAQTIASQGYIPGLWIAPFVIDWRTDFCSFHREWVLRGKNDKPVEAGFNFIWGAPFGINQPGHPFSYFCLDLSNDDVIEYLDSLMDKIINTWGFRYVKIDFLFTGMLTGKFQNEGTAYKWYDRALKIITSKKTNNKGERVAYLGCGLPFESSFNNLPLSRIGPDTKEQWDHRFLQMLRFSGRPSAKMNIQSTLGHAFWDQAIYINDPDVIFLRSVNIKLTETEKELIALVNFLFASQIMHSDDPILFNEKNDGLLTKHITDLYDRFSDEEFGCINKTNDTYIIFSRSQLYCGFINLSDKEKIITSNELLAYTPSDSVPYKLEPVVSHCINNADGSYQSSRRSISIFTISRK
jgi:alpha-galactosidase